MTPNDKLIPLRIRLPYGTEEEFIDRYGSNVARGGVFIATRALKPEGTPLAFEFVLADGTRLLRGEGVVVKAQVDEGGSRSGMTVRFIRLDAQSKAFIDRLVAYRSGISPPPPPEVPEPRTGLPQRRPADPPEQAPIARPASPALGEAPPSLQRRTRDIPVQTPKVTTPSASSSGHPPPPTRPPAPSPAALPPTPAPRDVPAVLPPAPAEPEPSWAVRSPKPTAPSRTSTPATVPDSPPPPPPAPVEPPPQVALLAAPEVTSPPTLLSGPAASGEATSDEPESLVAAIEQASGSLPVSTGPDPEPHVTPPPFAPEPTTRAGPREPEPAPPPPPPPSVPEPEVTHASREPEPTPPPASPPQPDVPRPAATHVAPREPEPADPPTGLEELSPDTARTPTAPTPRIAALSSSEEAKARRRSLLSVSLQPPTPSAPEPEELVLGIDLGTTNSRVAVFRDGVATLLPVDQEGRSFALPTIVAFDPQRGLLVGEAAREQMLRDPAAAVFGAKRLLGRRARSAKVKELVARFPYPVEADENGDAGVRLGDRVHRLPELYARILTELKEAAWIHLGREVTRAVLCVPAYFNDHQRAATREAGRLAGLDVLRLFNEPSAVALAFGYGKALARKRLLIYDLGGGTFDATVVEVTGDDLEVVATGGDNFLGGMDFDTKVAGELTRLFEIREQARLDPAPVTTQRLRALSEQVKIALSEQEVTPIHLPAAGTRNGAPVDMAGDFTREDLERVTLELVERTAQLTSSVLASGNLTFQGLDDVLLVGGQSRAPLVRRRIQELSGKPVRTDVDATAAVALGAAILGHSLLESSRGKPGVTLSEVLSAPIGIGVRSGGMLRVLDRNTRLPAEKTIGIPLRDGEHVSIAVFQGASTRADENEYLGCLSVDAEKSGELSLRFAVGPDGTLDLSAVTPGGKHAEVTLATQDTSDEVRAALFAQAPLPGEPEPPPGSKGLLGGIRKLFGRR